MSLLSTDLSLVLCAGAAMLPLLILGPASQVQSQPDADTKALVGRIDAARGAPGVKGALAIEGTFEIKGQRRRRQEDDPAGSEADGDASGIS